MLRHLPPPKHPSPPCDDSGVFLEEGRDDDEGRDSSEGGRSDDLGLASSSLDDSADDLDGDPLPSTLPPRVHRITLEVPAGKRPLSSGEDSNFGEGDSGEDQPLSHHRSSANIILEAPISPAKKDLHTYPIRKPANMILDSGLIPARAEIINSTHTSTNTMHEYATHATHNDYSCYPIRPLANLIMDDTFNSPRKNQVAHSNLTTSNLNFESLQNSAHTELVNNPKRISTNMITESPLSSGHRDQLVHPPMFIQDCRAEAYCKEAPPLLMVREKNAKNQQVYLENYMQKNVIDACASQHVRDSPRYKLDYSVQSKDTYGDAAMNNFKEEPKVWKDNSSLLIAKHEPSVLRHRDIRNSQKPPNTLLICDSGRSQPKMDSSNFNMTRSFHEEAVRQSNQDSKSQFLARALGSCRSSWRSEECLADGRRSLMAGRPHKSVSVKDRVAMFSEMEASAKDLFRYGSESNIKSATLGPQRAEPRHVPSAVKCATLGRTHPDLILPMSIKPALATPVIDTRPLTMPVKLELEQVKPVVSTYPETQLATHKRYNYGLYSLQNLKNTEELLSKRVSAPPLGKLKGLVIPPPPNRHLKAESSLSPTPPSSLVSPSSPSSVQQEVFQFSLSHSRPVRPPRPERASTPPSDREYEGDNSEDSSAPPPPPPQRNNQSPSKAPPNNKPGPVHAFTSNARPIQHQPMVVEPLVTPLRQMCISKTEIRLRRREDTPTSAPDLKRNEQTTDGPLFHARPLTLQSSVASDSDTAASDSCDKSSLNISRIDRTSPSERGVGRAQLLGKQQTVLRTATVPPSGSEQKFRQLTETWAARVDAPPPPVQKESLTNGIANKSLPPSLKPHSRPPAELPPDDVTTPSSKHLDHSVNRKLGNDNTAYNRDAPIVPGRRPVMDPAAWSNEPRSRRGGDFSRATSDVTESGRSFEEASPPLPPKKSPPPVPAVRSSITSRDVDQECEEVQALVEEAKLRLLEEEGLSNCLVVPLTLRREEGSGSVGVTLAGGSDYEVKEITVHRVIAGSIADRDGRVQRGDRLLFINGRWVGKGVAHGEALRLLKGSGQQVMLVLARIASESVNSAPPPQDSQSSQSMEGLHDVSVLKDATGLGFSIEGGKDSPQGDRPLRIKRIFAGGTADRTHSISEGDEILAVDGSSVAGMTRTQAWGILRKIPEGQTVRLNIRRSTS